MPAFTKTEFIWMNGELMPWDAAHIHVTAHALQYGTGVFEGMRSYDTPDGPAIFRLDAHMRRFEASASFYEIDVALFVRSALRRVARRRAHEQSRERLSASARVLRFAQLQRVAEGLPGDGRDHRGAGRAYIQGGPEHGVRVTVSTVRRIDAATLPPFVKACGHYTNSVRAVQEAIRRGYDDAILLNNKGDVAEGSGANLFIVRNGTLITNDIDASIVMGITRDSVLQIARDLGLPVDVRPMCLIDVQTADELFFSGTAVEITPIKELDGRVLGDGKPGPDHAPHSADLLRRGARQTAAVSQLARRRVTDGNRVEHPHIRSRIPCHSPGRRSPSVCSVSLPAPASCGRSSNGRLASRAAVRERARAGVEVGRHAESAAHAASP